MRSISFSWITKILGSRHGVFSWDKIDRIVRLYSYCAEA
jgi:hypothetical protein